MKFLLHTINSTALVFTGVEIERNRNKFANLLVGKKYLSLTKEFCSAYFQSLKYIVFSPLAIGMEAYFHFVNDISKKIKGE